MESMGPAHAQVSIPVAQCLGVWFKPRVDVDQSRAVIAALTGCRIAGHVSSSSSRSGRPPWPSLLLMKVTTGAVLAKVKTRGIIVDRRRSGETEANSDPSFGTLIASLHERHSRAEFPPAFTAISR